jgi:hypothetical protein
MSNFKSGSGNLDFGGSDEDEESEGAEKSTTIRESQPEAVSSEAEQSESAPVEESSSDTGASAERHSATEATENEGSSTKTSAEKYPYFIRRNNVGDERDTRLEIHVRDKVANQEAKFRNELADHLGASEVSKTDAREFALLVAFQHPDRVAELMRDEGFGALD